MGNDQSVGLGLIGCGAFGIFCLEAYSKLPDVRIAAVADVRREAADAFAERFGVPGHNDPAELIARDDVDLVHVATPPSTHHALVLAAVNAGKNVLCEKPLAMSVAEADEMLAAAKEAGVIVPVNFVLRYNPVTDAVKAILDSGVLGRPLAAHLTNCAGDTPLAATHWFWDKSLSGGIFIEHGVHFFDLYSYWFGDGEIIAAHTETRDGTPQEDRVMCTIRYESGTVAGHYHGFDQMTLMDRTDHRIICEMGDLRVEGWIPLRLTVDAAVDEAGVERLAELCPGAAAETVEVYKGERGRTMGRGRPRNVTRRVRLSFCPEPDKPALYSQSARDLLADQIARMRDSSHGPKIDERNGRDAVALAEAAARMAET